MVVAARIIKGMTSWILTQRITRSESKHHTLTRTPSSSGLATPARALSMALTLGAPLKPAIKIWEGAQKSLPVCRIAMDYSYLV